jgi:hypothetical protein
MSILPCLHSVPALPGALFRKQIFLPAVHSVDNDAPSERLSARPRRLAAPSPAPFPLAGRLRRTCGASGRDSGKPADGHPRRPAARGTLGRRARLGPLSATAIGLTSPSESALDITGPGRQASPCCSPARIRAGTPGGTSTAPTATAGELGELAAAQLIVHSAKVTEAKVDMVDDVLADLP